MNYPTLHIAFMKHSPFLLNSQHENALEGTQEKKL